MGWGSATNVKGREVGYNIEAECDHPNCVAGIDRGLGYVCGGMHDGGEHGCGDYFCSIHLVFTGNDNGESPGCTLCEPCADAWEARHPDDEAA